MLPGQDDDSLHILRFFVGFDFSWDLNEVDVIVPKGFA